jgi:hypothetical protein
LDLNRLKIGEDATGRVFATSTSTSVSDNNTQSSQNSNPFEIDRSRCGTPAPSGVFSERPSVFPSDRASVFSTSTRNQIISPPRLLNSSQDYAQDVQLSWIGAGFWQSPQKKFLTSVQNQAKPPTRSSSQSSGIYSTNHSPKNSRESSLGRDEQFNGQSLYADLAHRPRHYFGNPTSAVPHASSLFGSKYYSRPQVPSFITTYNNIAHRNFRDRQFYQ